MQIIAITKEEMRTKEIHHKQGKLNFLRLKKDLNIQ